MTAMLKITGARAALWNCIVANVVNDNRPWILKHKFHGKNDPKMYATLDKVRDAGEIDSEFWYRSGKAV